MGIKHTRSFPSTTALPPFAPATEPHNTPHLRSRVELNLPHARTLRGYSPTTSGAGDGGALPTEGAQAAGVNVASPPGIVRVVYQHQLPERVTDPSVLVVLDPPRLLDGGTFQLEVSVCMRKGNSKPPTPKALGEDAVVTSVVALPGHPLLPFIATLDGGGGAQLAQYGQKRLAAVLTDQIKLLLAAPPARSITSELLHAAMARADQILFNRDDPLGAPSEAYRSVALGHAEVEKITGLPAGEIVRVFQRGIREDCKGLNPAETHAQITAASSAGTTPAAVLVETPKKAYNLADAGDAAAMQAVYELAMGTVVRMECQLNIVTFHFQPPAPAALAPDQGGVVVATTYNRGDCIAFATSSGGRLTALSTPVGGLTTNGSAHAFPGNPSDGGGGGGSAARVTQCCDGHREKVSLIDQEGFDAGIGSDLGAAEYVELLGKASAWVGGGDDVTIVSARIQPGVGPQPPPPNSPLGRLWPHHPSTATSVTRVKDSEFRCHLVPGSQRVVAVTTLRDHAYAAAAGHPGTQHHSQAHAAQTSAGVDGPGQLQASSPCVHVVSAQADEEPADEDGEPPGAAVGDAVLEELMAAPPGMAAVIWRRFGGELLGVTSGGLQAAYRASVRDAVAQLHRESRGE